MGLSLAVLMQAAVTFVTVAQGTMSQIMEPREIVIRSVDEWQALWREHTRQPSPPIDFAQSIVVGIFLGTRPTAGYGVEVAAIKPDGGSLIVEYRERRPGSGDVVAQVLTSPFHLVRIPRDNRTVEFRKPDGP